MTPHTQTNIDPGNCWQTAVACVLDVDPDSMPAQCDHESVDESGKLQGSYGNALRSYLREHHRLTYTEIYPHQFAVLQMKDPGYHVLIGPTIRSAENGRNHAVVGRYGAMVWDPHPSRAGLLSVASWGLIGPFPADWDEFWSRSGVLCECPNCKRGRTP